MASIELRQISKHFVDAHGHETPVLRDLSLDI
jgi:hypothetical protein